MFEAVAYSLIVARINRLQWRLYQHEESKPDEISVGWFRRKYDLFLWDKTPLVRLRNGERVGAFRYAQISRTGRMIYFMDDRFWEESTHVRKGLRAVSAWHWYLALVGMTS